MPTPNDKPAPHWGGDEITVEGVQLTPEGEECVKLFDRYAMQRFGEPKEGDILAWLSDGKAVYGHVEVITPAQARHYRRQTWRHRVALVFGWLRGNR